MRIVVFSDSHGSLSCLEKVIERNKKSDIFVHLGDGAEELDTLKLIYPDYDIRGVRGNCDFTYNFPDMMIIDAVYTKVLFTHGHIQGVKYGLETLKKVAEENGAGVVCYGHTHIRDEHFEDGIHFLNPGSIARPADFSRGSYGFVDIVEKGIISNIVEV